MTRLIDADALLDFLDVGHLRPPTEICFSELMMKNIIELMPTVDAVPVIRCKDCKHWESMPSSTAAPEIHRCRYWRHIGTVAYDFCGRAERREK